MSQARPTRRRLLQTAAAAACASALTRPSRAADPKPAKIRIGQIGVGHAHASGKMESYRASEDFEVVGIAEPDAGRRARAEKSEAYRGLKWMGVEELLNAPGLQAVAVESEVKHLLGHAEAAVAAGMHIHLDKPAGADLAHFQRVLAAAEAKDLCVQMGYMYRYNPGFALMRDLLAKGWLGEPFEVSCAMGKVLGAGTRAELAKDYPGGTMFELGCHLIDMVVGLLGKPEATTAFSRHSAGNGDGFQDNMLAVLEYPKATATVRSAGVEVEGFARRHFTLCGTEGTLHLQPLDAPAARLALSKARGDYRSGYQDIALPKYRRYIDDAADFAAVIRGEKELAWDYAHDLAVQDTVLRASGLLE
ncbi:MAG: Gfo/Idh/MocA family oxidoreductase [Verrucomicrobiales bacterium]